MIGETPYSEGTGDRTDLTIPAAQAQVVKALKAAGLPTVVVLIAGRPMILDPILQYADAIVMAWLPGSEGAGITDILFGDVKPTRQAADDLAAHDGADPDQPWATRRTIRCIPTATG